MNDKIFDKTKTVGKYTFLHSIATNSILTLNSRGECIYVNKVSPDMSDEYFENFCEGTESYLKKRKA